MKSLFRWMFKLRTTSPIVNRRRQAHPLSRLRLEVLEDRFVLTAPTVINPGTIFVPSGQTIQVPLNGDDAENDNLTYTAVSDNANVTLSVPTGNPSIRIQATINGVLQPDMILQLYQDLAPTTVAQIKSLVDNGFYNTRKFHRIIPDFVAQLGNNAANQPDDTTTRLDDEYNADLTFNGFGQLAMAKMPADDSGRNQLFITDSDLSVAPGSTKRPPQSLNFDHTIFGQMTEGFDALAAITAVGGPAPDGTPTANVTIQSMTSFVDMENGVLRIKAAAGFTGSANITVTVKDSNGEMSEQTFTVTVVPDTSNSTAGGTAVNDKPFLGTIPQQNAVAGTPLTFQLPFTDIDTGDQHTFAVGTDTNFLNQSILVNQPANATVSLDQATGKLTVTPNFPLAGNITLKVGVRDNFAGHGTDAGAFDTQVITINVADTTNQLPVLGNVANVDAVSGTPKTFQLTSTDADAGDQRFFAVGSAANFAANSLLVNQPDNATVTVDQTTGNVTITPKVGFTGQIQVTVGVRDQAHSTALSAFDTQVVTINVTAADSDPRSVVRNGQLFVRGTSGIDIIELTLNGANVVVNTSHGGTAASFVAADLRRIIVKTGAGDDKVTVSSNMTLRTTLVGGKGADEMQGGAGNDIVVGNQGDDHVMGMSGDDRLKGGRGDDMLEGGTGNDMIRSKKGDDTALGGEGDDTVRGAKGEDQVDGGAGNDNVVGMDGPDLVFGGAGADTVRGGKGDNDYGPSDAADIKDGFKQNRDNRPGTFTDDGLLGDRMDLKANAPSNTAGGQIQTGEIDYVALGFTNPPHILPSYGPHHQTPVTTGVSADELAEEDVLANLEVGHVWITYDPSQIGADKARLEGLVSSFGANSGVVLSPRTGQGVQIVLTSWAHQLTLGAFDASKIRNFILTNRAHGPSAFASP